jgi:hypothetical protein
MDLNERIQKVNSILQQVSHPDLKDAWADLRDVILSVREELAAAKESIRQLQSKLSEKEKYLFREGRYWDATGKDETAFCKRCMEEKRIPFHLSPYYGGFRCDSCNWYCDKNGIGWPSPPTSAPRGFNPRNR